MPITYTNGKVLSDSEAAAEIELLRTLLRELLDAATASDRRPRPFVGSELRERVRRTLEQGVETK